MKAQLVGPDSASWASVLRDRRHDFYHKPGYVTLSADREGGTPRALLVEDGPSGLFLPLVIRPIPGGGVDAASPYGYPGPLAWGTPEPDFMREAFQAGIALLRSERIVSLFVRLHPLLNAAAPNIVPSTGVGTVVSHGDTVSIDLTRPSDELWTETRLNHRRDITKAVRAGYVARLDETWEHFGTFVRQYRETMERLGADERYRFDEAYFMGLREALGSSLFLWLVENDEAIAASALFVETSGIVQYHLAGYDELHIKDRPKKLMINAVRSWAQQRGDTRLHLGGGVGAAYDSLMHFKAGFSDERHLFQTLRVVVDEDEYGRLVGARELSLDPADLEGFFPLYRIS